MNSLHVITVVLQIAEIGIALGDKIKSSSKGKILIENRKNEKIMFSSRFTSKLIGNKARIGNKANHYHLHFLQLIKYYKRHERSAELPVL